MIHALHEILFLMIHIIKICELLLLLFFGHEFENNIPHKIIILFYNMLSTLE